MIAKDHNLKRLHDLAARIPFDDRINHQANLQDLDLGLIQAYLHEVKSDLLAESRNMSFEDLCRMMLIAKGPAEYLKPVNVGLLFFSTHPENFFPRSWIELVLHSDQLPGKKFSEVYFKGPLHKQLRDIISYFNTHIVREVVEKQDYKAEADRYFNFPLVAIEEVLSNAVYHKSYDLGSPIEVQVWPDKIEVLSYPGPVPPVDAQVVRTQRRIVAREYRNRRIGDFLKELELTEGRGTGFPAIYDAMEKNGSPDPVFETDQDRNYFLAILPAHQGISNEVGNGATTLSFSTLDDLVKFSNGAGKSVHTILNESIHDRVQEMLSILSNHITRQDLFDAMDLTNQSRNRAKYLDPLINLGWVSQDYPREKTNPNQRYKITEAGERILKLLTQ